MTQPVSPLTMLRPSTTWLVTMTFVILSFAIRHSVHAAIVYSGLQNIPIPTNFDGVYLDLKTGSTSTTPFTGWDINFFFGGYGIANSADLQPARTGSGNEDAIIKIDLGDTVGPGLNYSSGEGGSGSPNSHLGTGVSQLTPGVESYIAVKLTDVFPGTAYGWMRVKLTANQPGGVVEDWAYDDSGATIQAGSLAPEPSRCLLLLLGGTALGLSRRRR